MFFVLSKVVWALISPASLIFLLLTTGLLAMSRWRRIGIALIFLAAIALFIFGVLPTGHNLIHHLEATEAKPDPMPGNVTGILVLGGGIETAASEASAMPEVNDSADRILAGLMLARRYPDAKLVFSGGSGMLTRPDLRESAVIKALLGNIDFPDNQVLYEDSSRNTFENIRNTKDMVTPDRQDIWILVTSAYHMNRSMAVARQLGWNLLPYPVDYQTTGDYVLWPASYDVLRSLYLSELALREWVGFAAYRLTGKL